VTKGATTPPVITFLTTWRLDPVALAAIVLSGILYALGVFVVRRRGEPWPLWPTLNFYLLGLGSFAVVSFGFLGAYSMPIRWAFTTRIAMLLFAVPGLISLGKPVTLAKSALSGMPVRMLDAVLRSWPVRLMGNAVFAPLFALAAFMVFLTPLAGSVRESLLAENLITLLVPLIGLIMVLPIIEHTTQRTGFYITVEFMLVFAELVIDAIPGILLRLNETVLDHVPAVIGALPSWFPNPLHDQHLSGDFLWFIAEIADVPVLILLFIRWSKVDRHEAKALDDLSDEEMEALTREHLRSHH
ncbi:MAG: cytochrome c oxidase assembly protein, partial [Microbacteriaceae bacterium]